MISLFIHRARLVFSFILLLWTPTMLFTGYQIWKSGELNRLLQTPIRNFLIEITKPDPTQTPTPKENLFKDFEKATPTKKPIPKTLNQKTQPPVVYPTSTPYVFPTPDWTWINQKAAENKALFEQNSAKNAQDSQNWYDAQVKQQQADYEAWKKANGFSITPPTFPQ